MIQSEIDKVVKGSRLIYDGKHKCTVESRDRTYVDVKWDVPWTTHTHRLSIHYTAWEFAKERPRVDYTSFVGRKLQQKKEYHLIGLS